MATLREQAYEMAQAELEAWIKDLAKDGYEPGMMERSDFLGEKFTARLRDLSREEDARQAAAENSRNYAAWAAEHESREARLRSAGATHTDHQVFEREAQHEAALQRRQRKG